MSKGRRYSGEEHLNLKKVFAVFIAFVVIVMAIVIIKNVLTKAKNSKPVEVVNYFALYQDEKWGILGSNGEIIINPMYQEMPIVIDSSKDVFLSVYDINEELGTYKTKAINSKNEEIFTIYDEIEALENYDESGNVWYEENIFKAKKDGLWGLIDLSGNELLKAEYEEINTIKGIKNSILVKKEGLFGLVNDKGVKILDTNFLNILSFENDYKNGYITVNQENKYGLVNFSGDVILDNTYEKIENIYGEKYFVVIDSGKQKLINKSGEDVLTSGFDEIVQIAYSGIIFKLNNKYGFMDYEGNVKIPANYDDLVEINNDIFKFGKEQKFGLINIEENQLVDSIYTGISYNKKANIYIAEDDKFVSYILNSGFEVKLTGLLSEVNTDSGYMKINQDGEYKYYNFKFEQKNIQDILPSNKIFVSKKDGKFGFVNNKGNVVVDYIYDDALELNKYGYSAIKKDGLWGAIDRDGNIVIEPYYDLSENLVIDFIGKWHLGLDLNMNYYCEK